MRRFNTLATVVITGPQLARGAAAMLETQDDISKRLDTRVAASPLGDDGVVLRLASTDVEALGARLRRELQFVCALIGDDPWLRRW